jgi:RND family efflux transporter MFP subunit
MKGWRIVAILLLCLVLAGSGACGGGQQGAEKQPVEVARGDLAVSISGSGNIDVSREANLTFGSGGRVDKIYVEEGDKVSKGNVLAKLDTGDLELALAQAKLALEQAEYNLNQLKDVLHASQDRIQIAESELEVAEQTVARAQKQLDEATITAPFDGIVAAVYAKEGDIIPSPTMSSMPLVYLIDLSSMELTAEVDEIDIPDVKPGQSATISVDALPEEQFDGVVTSISSLPVLEAGIVLYKVKISLDAPEGSRLKLGMSATADIIVEHREDVLLVPERAIERDSQGNYIVWVELNGKTEARPVVIGISDGLQTEILSGLQQGETVVIER